MANVGGAAASVPQPLAGLEDMEAYLEQHSVRHISWHTRLHQIEQPRLNSPESVRRPGRPCHHQEQNLHTAGVKHLAVRARHGD